MAQIRLTGVVEVGLPHLHELADDRPVGEQLDLAGQ